VLIPSLGEIHKPRSSLRQAFGMKSILSGCGRAGQNGYVADHSAAAARSAIHSGLRNGLRNPGR